MACHCHDPLLDEVHDILYVSKGASRDGIGRHLKLASKAQSPAMMINAHAILVLEDLRHHVGPAAFALPFGFLGIIWLPFVPLPASPSIHSLVGELASAMVQGGRQSLGCEGHRYGCIKWAQSRHITPD